MQDQARRAEQRRAEMRTALGSLAPLTAIPVHLSTDFVSLDPGVTQVVVSGSVDVTALPFVRRSDRLQATVETVALVYDEAGAVAATLETERTTLDLTDADYAQLRRRGVPYRADGPPQAGPIPGAPRGARGRHGAAGERLGEDRDPGPGRGPPDPQQPLPPEGRRDVRGAGRPGKTRPPCTASRTGPGSAAPRACTCSSTRTTRSATRRARSTSSSQAEVLRKGTVLATAAPEPMTTADSAGHGPPPVPRRPAALRTRRVRAAHHRHRPQGERDRDAQRRVHGRSRRCRCRGSGP